MGDLEPLSLDTTIQIDKLTEKQNRKDEIRNFIEGRKLFTSTYVLMEFNKTLMRSCISLHKIVSKEESIADVHTEISNMFSNQHSTRSLYLRVLGEIERQIESDDINDILAQLELFIEVLAYPCFFESISEVLDSSECLIAQERVFKINDGYKLNISCKEVSIQRGSKCKISSFIRSHLDNFKKILEVLQSIDKKDKELINMEKALREVIEEPENIQFKNCRDYLGDAIIVVESPKECTIYTTDKHFDILAPAKDKKVKIERYDG